MKLVNGAPTEEFRKTHVRVFPWAIKSFEFFAVPLKRFKDDLGPGEPGMVWAPSWAAQVIAEWPDGAEGNVFTESVVKRVISYSARTDDAEFALACLAAARLAGAMAVEQMLTERKDLLR